MDMHQFSESDGLPQIEKVWDLDVNELVIEPKPFARGAFSQVYKGEYFGTKICVKLLKSDDAELLKFTIREVSSLKFSHPNIVQFIGVAERNDEVLIATEYVAGGNLRQYLKDHNVALPWELRIKIAIDIASGMAFLHSKNVIHRDLKSKNILVSDNWRIKVCDFGFARSVTGNRRQLMTVCGTNDWMAPELLLGHPYDEKADVFSFGIVLVELLTRGKVGEDVRRGPETQYRVDEDLLRAIVPKDTPASLLDLTMLCCSYDSRDRPSFKEITKMLKSMLKKKSTSPAQVPRSLPSPQSLSPPKAKPSPIASNSFSLSSLSGALPSVNSTSKKSKPERAAPYPAIPLSPVSWTTSWDSSHTSSPASSLYTSSPAQHTQAPPASPATHGNPLYRPRPFAEVVLTDSHPRRFEEAERKKTGSNHVEELTVTASRKRDHARNNVQVSEEASGEGESEEALEGGSKRDAADSPLLRRRPANSGSNKRSRR